MRTLAIAELVFLVTRRSSVLHIGKMEANARPGNYVTILDRFAAFEVCKACTTRRCQVAKLSETIFCSNDHRQLAHDALTTRARSPVTNLLRTTNDDDGGEERLNVHSPRRTFRHTVTSDRPTLLS